MKGECPNLKSQMNRRTFFKGIAVVAASAAIPAATAPAAAQPSAPKSIGELLTEAIRTGNFTVSKPKHPPAFYDVRYTYNRDAQGNLTHITHIRSRPVWKIDGREYRDNFWFTMSCSSWKPTNPITIRCARNERDFTEMYREIYGEYPNAHRIQP